MNYKALNTNKFNLENYSIVPLRQEDIYLIKDWRNAQMDVLRQTKVLTDNDQLNYYQNAIVPTLSQSHPRQLLFSFLYNETCIGYGGLTNIDWESKRAEMSFLVNPERVKDKETYTKDFSIYISLLKIVTFNELGFIRLFTETYDIRPLHISILEQNGFEFEGRMRQHVIINGIFVDSLIHGLLKK